MADTKFSQLPQIAPDLDDRVVVLDDPGGSPLGATAKVRDVIGATGAEKVTAVVQTTGATPTVIAAIPIPTDNVVGLLATAVGIKNDQTQGAHYVDALTVRNNAGTVTQVGTATRLHSAEDAAGMDLSSQINGANVEFLVTGLAATTIDWRATVETVKRLAS